MAWFRCGGGNGGGSSSIIFKNYIKFNGEGLKLPWSINADHKIEVVFYEVSYYNDSSIIGNSFNARRIHLTEYSNKYYCSSGDSEANFGAWSSGEHEFVCNNGNNKNEFDGAEVTTYSPSTVSDVFYTIGCRGAINQNVFYGYIKSFKIYSIANNTLLHHLKPAIINDPNIGVNCVCFIDIVGGGIYTNPSIQAFDAIPS